MSARGVDGLPTPEVFMNLEALSGWPGILAFVIVAVCIASIFGLQLRPPGASRTKERAASGRNPEVAAARSRETSEKRPILDRTGFGEAAQERLEPMLRELIDRIHANGFEAGYQVTGEAQATTYRLEVTRPDHPVGQPLPYITFSAGEGGLVEVIYGGVFPGPSDQNRSDTEIGWRTVRWDQVDNLIASFAHKVLARFD